MLAPQFVVIAGPNGAGKSTIAPAILPAGVPYINADEIAKGLADGNRDIEAGRRFIHEWARIEQVRGDFAIETTLASRSLAPKIRRLKGAGYQFRLIFLWLPNVDLAVERVAERVRAGGHNIPVDTIRRRYRAGLKNLIELYLPLADTWSVYQNEEPGDPTLIGNGSAGQLTIINSACWKALEAEYGKSELE